MSALFVLIAISLLVAIGFLFAFLWATNSGQYEDDYTPSVRMLFDDNPVSKDVNRNLSYKKDAGKLYIKEKSQQNKFNQI